MPKLRLLVRTTENPDLVMYALVDSEDNPLVTGEFPTQEGPPANTVRAIAELVIGMLEAAAQAAAKGGKAWLN